MIKNSSGNIIFSPSDLTAFIDSPFASWMERYNLEVPDHVIQKDAEDAYMKLLANRGIQHEESFLEKTEQTGRKVKVITSSKGQTDDDKFELTKKAMQEGWDVIYQGCLMLKNFRGYSDFLFKVPGKSALGGYHYEVWDTKLASSVKTNHILQLCCYVEMLEAIQECRPEYIVVALGSDENERVRTSDHFDYYSQIKNQFMTMQDNFDPTQQPDPADFESYGKWSDYANSILTKRDHLSAIANIRRTQIKKLNDAGIYRCDELINAENLTVKGMKSEIVARLQAQARIQKESGNSVPAKFEVLEHPPGEKIGLALLPPASPKDVFFDIEGNPLIQGGLEYLWGNTYLDENDDKQFKDFWAHDNEQEKKAFKAFIDWVYARWQADPTMHIYHYAQYEITACRKLMGRYGICEVEVDQLLRNEVFVDLYKVVKGAILLGQPRYSIKNLEYVYREQGRDTEVANGAESIVVYEDWRESFLRGEDTDDWRTSKALNGIRDYNIDDCDSTLELTRWLGGLQKEKGIDYLGKTEVVEPEISEEITRRTQLRDRLLVKAETENSVQAALTRNLANILEFHRRERKPMLWRLFDRKGSDPEELFEELDCLSGCIRNDTEPYKLKPRDRSLVYEYQFDPDQEFKGNAKQYFVVGEENKKGNDLTVELIGEASDFTLGVIRLKSSQVLPDEVTLIPKEGVNTSILEESIESVVSRYDQMGSPNIAIFDFLLKKPARIRGRENTDTPIFDPTKPVDLLEQTVQAVVNLDASYLAIQGPPGAGKTYTGKHIIGELIRQGKRVGISSNSHKAINNLLIGVAEHCSERVIPVTCFCNKQTDDQMEQLNIQVIKNEHIHQHIDDATIFGTTAWGFSRDDVEGKFDYLFIDEAGQVSVANLVAMSRSAKNLVLLGDQMQLGQPSQAKHPEDSGLSILDYLLHETPIIPPNMGIFLNTTYRMHPKVNEFISDAVYQGQLQSDPGTKERYIEIPENHAGVLNQEAGIHFIPVEHIGNAQASNEEVAAIKELVAELLGREFMNKGEKRPVQLSDMLFVAPYNHQVNKLKAVLGDEAKVGSVDKFQGQEAPIVFFSLCSSDAAESARGIDFLFDKHRLNVAISRAQCLAIVVGNPSLFGTPVNSVEQMAKVNMVAKLAGYVVENSSQGNIDSP